MKELFFSLLVVASVLAFGVYTFASHIINSPALATIIH